MNVGRKNGDPKPDIVLGGIGIQANHAVFEKRADGVYIVPRDEKAALNISVNGQELVGLAGHKLLPNDRLIFGTGSFFLFKDPKNEAAAIVKDLPENPISYEQAEEEKEREDEKEQLEEQKKIKEQEEAIRAKELAKIEKQRAEELKAQEEKGKKMKEGLEQKKDSLTPEQMKVEEQKIQEKMDSENRMKDMKMNMAKEMVRKKGERVAEEQANLHATLKRVLTDVAEANLSAQEMHRKVLFKAQLKRKIQNPALVATQKLVDNSKVEVIVRVDNSEAGYFYEWPIDKFDNRLQLIRDLLEDFFEDGVLPEMAKEKDPFWDPPEAVLIGHAYIKLEALAYVMDSEIVAKIYDTSSQKGTKGEIHLQYVPTTATGSLDLDPNDLPEDDPKEMSKFL